MRTEEDGTQEDYFYGGVDPNDPRSRSMLLTCSICGHNRSLAMDDAVEVGWAPEWWLGERQFGTVCPVCIKQYLALDKEGVLTLRNDKAPLPKTKTIGRLQYPVCAIISALIGAILTCWFIFDLD